MAPVNCPVHGPTAALRVTDTEHGVENYHCFACFAEWIAKNVPALPVMGATEKTLASWRFE